MSEPKNHHIISKVHLKNFFNKVEGKIFLYDKIKQNFFPKTTLKSIFSEDYSNSIYDDGVIDHVTLEKELNVFFEKDFKKNISIIQRYISDKNQTDEVIAALLYFLKYGIIAEMRTSKHKEKIDQSVFGMFEELKKIAAPELEADFKKILEFRKHVKYSNTISYIEIANEILEKMGNIRYDILIANQNDYFFIPDFGAASQREKINEYFNPNITEIAYVGIPLTSKIYINFYSTKLYKNIPIPSSSIHFCDFKTVEFYNCLNFRYCESKLACENEKYLKDFIERNSTVETKN